MSTENQETLSSARQIYADLLTAINSVGGRNVAAALGIDESYLTKLKKTADEGGQQFNLHSLANLLAVCGKRICDADARLMDADQVAVDRKVYQMLLTAHDLAGDQLRAMDVLSSVAKP